MMPKVVWVEPVYETVDGMSTGLVEDYRVEYEPWEGRTSYLNRDWLRAEVEARLADRIMNQVKAGELRAVLALIDQAAEGEK